MTGRLRLFTGSEQQADHERRIRELERALKAKQTNLPRRPASGDRAGVVLYGDIVNAGIVQWDAPDPTQGTYNLGGFFTVVDGFIKPASDCIVDVTASADWALTPAGSKHLLEITRLYTWSPVSDARWAPNPTDFMQNNASAAGRLNASDSGLHIVLTCSAGAVDVSSVVSVTLRHVL